MNKKLVSVVLAATTLLWGVGIATLPLANAQTTADLQAQIAALLAQIQQLQAQLNAASSGSSMAAAYNYTRDLTVGSTGADVKALQEFLNANGAQLAASGAGSPGNETTYFGALTKAALAKYQAAHGIAPAAGYFGPITRAYIASLHVATTTTGTTTTTVTPPATGLAVSLSSQNPAAGSLISSSNTAAARVPVLAINLTASNSGAVMVTDLKVHKTGVLSDSSISGAYLTQNGQVLYQYTSLNNGIIDFSSMNFSVPAGQTETLFLAIDPSTGLSPGNTVGFAVDAASDVTAVDTANNAVTPSGSFPLTGNIFTVTSVSNPSLASLTVTSSSIGTLVTAGTQANIVGAWTFNGQNSLTYLKGIKFTVIGSANNANIRNVKIDVNGTQVGPTLATVAADGTAYFDLSSSPASMNTGNNNLQVFADVMGSPDKNFQFEILNSYDVLAVDSQYNVPVTVTVNGGIGTLVDIQQGKITVSQDTGTPTGNIAVGQTGVTLAKFDIYAAGEPVKVKFLGFELAMTGVATSSPNALTISDMIKNVSLVDDAGGQVGTTINTPPSGNTCDAPTALSGYTSKSDGTITNSTVDYVDCFGTNSSPINYIVPANTTRVLSLKADIQSNAAFNTITGSLVSESGENNLQGLTSSGLDSSSGATGSALTLQSTLLTVGANSAYGNQNITPNSTNVKIGSYAFTASSASGVQINTVSLEAAKNNSGSSDIQNLRVMVGGAQFGTEQGVVTDGDTYTFSGSPFTVPAGGTTYVDAYADILSNASSSIDPATSLNGCSGTSVVSYTAVSCSGTKDGQNLTVSSGGADVTVGLDSSAPAAAQLVMGSMGNSLAAFRFTETSNVENVKITDLTVKQTQTATSSSAYQNVTLWNGSTLVGTAGSASSTSGGFDYAFHFGTPPIVPQNNTLILTLKGDVASYTALGGLLDNTTSTFGIAATSSVVALGQSSNIATNITGTPTGNTMTVLRTTLTPSATALGTLTGRVKNSVDNLATITVTANSAGSAQLSTLAITFSGSAIGASTTASNFTLLDKNNVNVTDAGSFAATVTSTNGCNASPCTITWTFGTSTNPFIVSAGNSYSFTLRADDTNFVVASGSATVGLSATLQNTTSTTYYDNTTLTGSTVSLPTTLVPIPITTVSFATGS
jgi:Putative peptidoglycan binding domain